jgi:sulfite oxidase
MEHLAIGRLADEDQAQIDEQMEVLQETDPYAREPMRHKALVVHSDTPMNAEVPATLICKSYLTPNALFYIRHHHPVPYLPEKSIKDYRLKVDLTAYGKGVIELSLDDLKKMKKVEVTATL